MMEKNDIKEGAFIYIDFQYAIFSTFIYLFFSHRKIDEYSMLVIFYVQSYKK